MRFYDKKGGKHDSIIGAYMSDLIDRIDQKLREKMPGYGDVVDDDHDVEFSDIESDTIDPIDDVDDTYESDEDVKTDISSDEPITPIIDYAHGTYISLDKNGDAAATVVLDNHLIDDTIDKELSDILYGGLPPEEVRTDIESIGREVEPNDGGSKTYPTDEPSDASTGADDNVPLG